MEDKIFKYGLICGKLEEVYNRSGFNLSVFNQEEFIKYVAANPKEIFERIQDMNDVINAVLEIARVDRFYQEEEVQE